MGILRQPSSVSLQSLYGRHLSYIESCSNTPNPNNYYIMFTSRTRALGAHTYQARAVLSVIWVHVQSRLIDRRGQMTQHL